MMTRAQMYERFVEFQRLRDAETPGSTQWKRYQRQVARYFEKVYAKELKGEKGP